MGKYLTYKGFQGTAEIDLNEQICRGKILFIDNLMTYESISPIGLEKAFQETVEEYLRHCAMLNKEPLPTLKGMVKVHVPPSLYKTLVLQSLNEDSSLNEVILNALEEYVSTSTKRSELMT